MPVASKLSDIVRVAIAVVEHDGDCLVGRRPDDVPLAGYWEFPGGKLEPGESPHQAAVRECREETGLAIWPRLNGDLVVRHAYPHGEIELTFVRCELAVDASRSPRPPFQWVPIEQLDALKFPPANEQILSELRRQG